MGGGSIDRDIVDRGRKTKQNKKQRTRALETDLDTKRYSQPRTPKDTDRIHWNTF